MLIRMPLCPRESIVTLLMTRAQENRRRDGRDSTIRQSRFIQRRSLVSRCTSVDLPVTSPLRGWDTRVEGSDTVAVNGDYRWDRLYNNG